uniref:Uncharacterized protein n=1 Tax=Helianthus annuus TaxID=4232 RepID=A0A251S6F1_HELAN
MKNISGAHHPPHRLHLLHFKPPTIIYIFHHHHHLHLHLSPPLPTTTSLPSTVTSPPF